MINLDSIPKTGIDKEEVYGAVLNGEVIEEYAENQ